MAEKAGSIDVSFNAILNDEFKENPLAEMPFDISPSRSRRP